MQISRRSNPDASSYSYQQNIKRGLAHRVDLPSLMRHCSSDNPSVLVLHYVSALIDVGYKEPSKCWSKVEERDACAKLCRRSCLKNERVCMMMIDICTACPKYTKLLWYFYF